MDSENLKTSRSKTDNLSAAMEPDYFSEFDERSIHHHAVLLQNLSSDTPCAVRMTTLGKDNDEIQIEIAGLDLPGAFAIVAGTMTFLGCSIQSGITFTSTEKPDATVAPFPFFINRFRCYFKGSSSWLQSQIQNELHTFLTLLKSNQQAEIKRILNQKIGRFLSQHTMEARLYPIRISFDTDKNDTVMHVTGQSTPAFLYGLANALWTEGMVFRKMKVDTHDHQVNDVFYLQDRNGLPIDNPDILDNLRVIVVLVKHFTLFLPMASDHDLALKKFDQFLDQVVRQKLKPTDLVNWEQSKVLATMAKAFGTGEYLWEEFIKFQSEALLPLLRQMDEIKITRSKLVMESELVDQIGSAPDFETKVKVLNRFKDHELFRIDLLYLVYPNRTFVQFSRELTDLAEVVINSTTHLVRSHLSEQYGSPQTPEKKPCRFAVMALGKFGSKELGYASDLELVFIYESNGYTSNPENSISNIDFFNKFVKGLTQSIKAKKAGIFEIDLRLRPHGMDGPPACSLETWEKYYHPQGQAHDFERQALIKLRSVYGDRQFVQNIMEARDHLIYGEHQIAPDKTLTLRKKQLQELIKPGLINVKYSPGGLCEIEYGIQFLQLRHGAEHPRLRTQNTIEAMEVLLELEILSATEFEKLYYCEAFLRRLINALRLVRGNAKDLILPQTNSPDFQFLSRRMGYSETDSTESKLQEDIENVFQTVHLFFKARFIDFSGVPQFEAGLPEILSKENPSQELIEKVLGPWKFKNIPSAYETLRNIRKNSPNRILYSVLVLASRTVRRSPSPDKCLIQMEKFLMNQQIAPNILQQMLYHPRYIEIAVTILGYGDFLSNILIQYPYFLYYVSGHSSLESEKSSPSLKKEITQFSKTRNLPLFLDDLRIFNHRELLRIGIRDIFLKKTLGSTIRELSHLADAAIHSVYHRLAEELGAGDLIEKQCFIAMGKLGGQELNYSSDVDLIFLREDGLQEEEIRRMDKWNQLCLKYLSESTAHGRLFRVDLNLRPYGAQGQTTGTLEYHKNYYRRKADPWELQAWFKARVLCGNKALGNSLINYVQQVLLEKLDKEKILTNIRSVRYKTLSRLSAEDMIWDVKQSPVGIRTIEFYVQYLQWNHGQKYPEIVSGHTMQSLLQLRRTSLITESEFSTLMEAYVFYRQIEHAIQFENMQQRHLIPKDPEKRDQLAKRMGIEDRLDESAGQLLITKYCRINKDILIFSERVFPGTKSSFEKISNIME